VAVLFTGQRCPSCHQANSIKAFNDKGYLSPVTQYAEQEQEKQSALRAGLRLSGALGHRGRHANFLAGPNPSLYLLSPSLLFTFPSFPFLI